MDTPFPEAGHVRVVKAFKPLCFLIGCGGLCFSDLPGVAQDRESLAGEAAAVALKESLLNEAQRYNIRYGPLAVQTSAGLRVGYTDNAFYSDKDRKDDVVVLPEARLAGFLQVSELNTLRLSLGLGYEYYVRNSVLNGDAPLVNPDSELAFNLFVSNFHIRLHEKFSYQETLFVNTTANGQDLLFNFADVGIFKRWDNRAGFDVDWDLDKLILSAAYDHENFVSSTASFEYLNRASEWLSASASLLLGDQAKAGLEGQAGYHDYETETVLNDHWQARGGPFAEVKLPANLNLRAGGGYETAQYHTAAKASDFDTYYVYARVSQETRFFKHDLSAGREHTLGDNANNLRDTYVRYSISSPVIEHVELNANASVHFAKEFAGPGTEDFTYYIIGLRAGYQFHKYWRTDLAYEYMLKNSDLPLRDFYRNRVTLGVSFTF